MKKINLIVLLLLLPRICLAQYNWTLISPYWLDVKISDIEQVGDGCMIAATEGDGILKKFNDRTYWYLFLDGIRNNKNIRFIYKMSNNNIIIGDSTGKIFRSQSHGQNWSEIITLKDTQSIAGVLEISENVIMCISENGSIYSGRINEEIRKIYSSEMKFSGIKMLFDDILIASDKGLLKQNLYGDWAPVTDDILNINTFVKSDNGNIIIGSDDGIHILDSNYTELPIEDNEGFDKVFVLRKAIDGKLFAGTDKGVWLSMDHGVTWIDISGINKYSSITAIAITDELSVYAGNTRGEIFLLNDILYNKFDISIDPDGLIEAYIGDELTFNIEIKDFFGKGIDSVEIRVQNNLLHNTSFIYTDDGKTEFGFKVPYLNKNVYTIDLLISKQGYITTKYCLEIHVNSNTGNGLWKSAISGNSYNINEFNDELYAINNQKLVKSCDGGETWFNVIDDNDCSRYFITQSGTIIYRQGDSTMRLPYGSSTPELITNTTVYLVFTQLADGRIFTYTQKHQFYYSDDDGMKWYIKDIPGIRAVYNLSSYNNYLVFFDFNRGVAVSKDSGETYSEISQFKYSYTIYDGKETKDNFYIWDDKKHFYRSADLENWEAVEEVNLKDQVEDYFELEGTDLKVLVTNASTIEVFYDNEWYDVSFELLASRNHNTIITEVNGRYKVVAATEDGLYYLDLEDAISSVVSAKEENSILIFPNPASDYINIPEIYGSVAIYSTLGIKVMEVNNPTERIDISRLSAGVYYISINGEFMKFVKI